MTDDDPTLDPSKPDPPEPPESTAGSGHPDRIGPYKILRLLGSRQVWQVDTRSSERSGVEVTCPHISVCDCTDNTTSQHVAVLSKIPLTGVLSIIPGREHFYGELDDAESEDDTGVSKGMRVTFQTQGQPTGACILLLAESG